MTNWLEQSATNLCLALRTRTIRATELLEVTLEQAHRVIPTINPLAVLLEEQARAAARAADELLDAGMGGALCGLPITVKDSQWLAGVPCANGSRSLLDFVPDETSEAIRRLEAAGAVIFAKTTCPEFCVSGTNISDLYGATANPWSPHCTPGGSSGGAAAAVASGVGTLSLGSDGGGSIRIPSAFCGIVGFKPSFGAVPRAPGFTTWESLVAYGPMARSVEDATLMFDVLVGDSIQLGKPDSQDAPARPVVYSDNLGFAPLDPDVSRCFQATVEKIDRAGITLHQDDPGLTSSVVTWATLATQDMWAHKRKDVPAEKQHTGQQFGDYANAFIDFGGQFSDGDVADAKAHLRAIHDAYVAMFQRHQARILITPTLGCEAFAQGRTHPARIGGRRINLPWMDWAGLLYDANLIGMPACSIPMGLGDRGMPLGLQILGMPGSDRDVLAIAAQIEEIIGWAHPVAPGMVEANAALGVGEGLPQIPGTDFLNLAPAMPTGSS